MAEKIKSAIRYFENHRDFGDPKEIKNDAANIYSDSYEEYMTIWDNLDRM